MNTFGVYRVPSKIHVLVLSIGFCRRVVDCSIYDTFMLTPDATPKGEFLDLPPDNSKQPIERQQVRRSNFN
jgi:hypothetical protein